MQTSEIKRLVLFPMALLAIDGALRSETNIDAAFVDQVAETLYRRHRSEPRGAVMERRFSDIPRSEQGKYRSIVREAIETFRNSPLFKAKI